MKCFKCCNAIETHNKLIFDFYSRRPHMTSSCILIALPLLKHCSTEHLLMTELVCTIQECLTCVWVICISPTLIVQILLLLLLQEVLQRCGQSCQVHDPTWFGATPRCVYSWVQCTRMVHWVHGRSHGTCVQKLYLLLPVLHPF